MKHQMDLDMIGVYVAQGVSIPIGLKPLVAPRDAAGLGFSECEKFRAGTDLGRGFPAPPAAC